MDDEETLANISGPFWVYHVEFVEPGSDIKQYQKGYINEPVSQDKAWEIIHSHFVEVTITKAILNSLETE